PSELPHGGRTERGSEAAADEVNQHVGAVELGWRRWVDRQNGALVGYLSGEQSGIEEAKAGQCQRGVLQTSGQYHCRGQRDDKSEQEHLASADPVRPG